MVKIRHYELKEKLGSGSFGQIYKGVHSQTGEIRALKLE